MSEQHPAVGQAVPVLTHVPNARESAAVYEMVGGESTFRALVDRFYAKVEADPQLRPMFPADLEPGKERQFLFLSQFFGGPRQYEEQRGHPRLRMRHAPFPIDRAAAAAWLGHMLAAMAEIGIPEPAYSLMKDYFTGAADFMRNQSER